jgi:hypothetical protein
LYFSPAAWRRSGTLEYAFDKVFAGGMRLSFMSGSRPGRWVVWVFYRVFNKPLPVPHAAEWMMIPEHSVDQVLETGALRSLYPQDVLEAARRMDRQRREHDERYARDS